MDIVASIILGIVQGVTELFPISSSGHLLLIPILFEELGIDLDFSFQDTRFDIIVHIATFFVISWVFRHKVKRLLQENLRGNLRNQFLTMIPALIFGGYLFLTDDEVTKQPLITAILLIVVGLVLIYIDIRGIGLDGQADSTKELTALSSKNAIWIGLFQSLALIRGTSRSGATLIGGLMNGLSRKAALDYAFIASLPLFAIITLVEIVQLFTETAPPLASTEQLIAGFVAAAISSWFTIKVFQVIINRHWALAGFGIYRVFLGIVVLFILATS